MLETYAALACKTLYECISQNNLGYAKVTNDPKLTVLKDKGLSWVQDTHIFNLCTQEAEEGLSLSSRPAWSTQWIPGQPETLLQNKKQNPQTNKKPKDWAFKYQKSAGIFICSSHWKVQSNGITSWMLLAIILNGAGGKPWKISGSKFQSGSVTCHFQTKFKYKGEKGLTHW